ncbi:MAG: RNA-binding protein [Patescibacteria group bacterium]
MAKRLFVGGLPFVTTEDELRDMFSPAGSVEEAKIITDKFSGRSKGFGFVEMSSDEAAKKAIDLLNNSQVGERTIVVNEARPLEQREER